MFNWKSSMWLIAGVFIGAILFSAMRTSIYYLKGAQPNMAAEMFIVFAPILSLPIVIITVVIHVLLRRKIRFNSPQWLFAGMCYSSVFLLLISPWLIFLVVTTYILMWRKGWNNKGGLQED